MGFEEIKAEHRALSAMPAPSAPVDPIADAWVVWSNVHDLYWGKYRRGYTSDLLFAGVYSREEAAAICRTRRRAPNGRPAEEAFRLSDQLAQSYTEPGNVAELVVTALRLQAAGK
jgi:hypothetical protein